jgi:hypothetical protein
MPIKHLIELTCDNCGKQISYNISRTSPNDYAATEKTLLSISGFNRNGHKAYCEECYESLMSKEPAF